MRLIIMGAPGCGKGTQGKTISDHYGIPVIPTGQLFRDAISSMTELGIESKKYINEGKLVPDHITIKLICERLASEDCSDGFLLDGFPRNVAQAKALDNMGVAIDGVLMISLDDDVIVERLSGRQVCKKCGASYHIMHNPSKQDKICDNCGGNLIIRDDDNPEVIRKRLAVYHAETEPVLDFYKKKNKLVEIASQGKVSDTAKLALKAVETFNDNN